VNSNNRKLPAFNLSFAGESATEELPGLNPTRSQIPSVTSDSQAKQLPPVSRLNLGHVFQRSKELYRPLHQGSSIRILEIQPGSFNNPIVSNFHYVDLEFSECRYKALSYVWGGKRSFNYGNVEKLRTVTIQCNGNNVKITNNLEQALNHVRSTSSPKLLWADAICINQDGQKERGHQVALMSLVYRKAHNVVVWLGEHDEWAVRQKHPDLNDTRAQRAFGAICEIVNHWKGPDSPMGDVIYQFNSETGGDKISLSHIESIPQSTTRLEKSQEFIEALKRHYPHTEPYSKSGWIGFGFEGKILSKMDNSRLSFTLYGHRTDRGYIPAGR
jgi:hypothetical protein